MKHKVLIYTGEDKIDNESQKAVDELNAREEPDIVNLIMQASCDGDVNITPEKYDRVKELVALSFKEKLEGLENRIDEEEFFSEEADGWVIRSARVYSRIRSIKEGLSK